MKHNRLTMRIFNEGDIQYVLHEDETIINHVLPLVPREALEDAVLGAFRFRNNPAEVGLFSSPLTDTSFASFITDGSGGSCSECTDCDDEGSVGGESTLGIVSLVSSALAAPSGFESVSEGGGGICCFLQSYRFPEQLRERIF